MNNLKIFGRLNDEFPQIFANIEESKRIPNRTTNTYITSATMVSRLHILFTIITRVHEFVLALSV